MPENSNYVGNKRKRSDTSQQEDLTAKLTGKLHHHVREVRKAAKKAKAFEVQKTVKKLKGLRSKTPDSPEVAALEEQLDLLKKCDHEPFADTALKTKIHKDKMLSENEHLTAAAAEELASNLVVPAAPGSNLAKVQGRLLSSKLIAVEVAAIIEALKSTISPEPRKGKERAIEEEAAEEVDGEEQEDEDAAVRPVKKSKLAQSNAEDGANDAEEDSDASSRVAAFSDEEGVDDAGWESGSIHEGSDDEDEGSEEDEDHDTDESEDESDAEPSTTSRKPSKPAPKLATPADKTSKAKQKSTADAKPGTSTFLPSLAVGYTRGDSDASDVSDGEDDAPKKNRRGQRARRAIWEKKFGRNANHVKKQQEIMAKGPRDNGWPRQNRAAPQDRSGTRQRPYPTSAKESQPPPGAPPPTTNGRKEEKALHPSWEAKRRLKEKQNPSIVAPQGKKIVF
ncbi:Bud-site selection protein [Trametopsis cervina]|nr:Bud-site selection protein [Trametopsis cervina]